MEWKTVKLGDIIVLHDSKRKPVSSMERAKHRGIYPYYGAASIVDYIDDYIFDGDYILLGEDGTVINDNGTPVLQRPSGKFWVSNHAHVITNSDSVDFNFLYYVLSHTNITSAVTGAVQMKISQKNLLNIELPLPPLSEQKRIAAILSSLDDKIENNNRINRNLEAQAQALFKSWFVDFVPFGGSMPEDWKEGTYNDIVEATISGDWGKEMPDGNYTHSVACIRGCDFEEISNGVRGKTPQRYILERNFLNKGLKDKDVVVEISGGTATVSTGRICLITEKLLQQYCYDIICTNFCRTVRPLVGYSFYLFYSWKYKYDRMIMFGYENGTSGIKNFAIKDFLEKEPLIIPPLEVLSEFNKMVGTMHDIIQHNGTDTTRLAALRDTLLPKLMKGEINI